MENNGIRDARSLGVPKMLVLGLQHMFAMFGATVLVPALTGLSVSATLLFAGLGTLLFHFLAKGKVPAFLGSSFAYLAGYAAIAPNGEAALLPYACVGVACSAILYIVLAALVKSFGTDKVMSFFPPVVTGPIIICIGLILANSAINNCVASWPIALLAIAVVIVCNIWAKGMLKIIPILLGVVGACVVAAVTGNMEFSAVQAADLVGLQKFTIAKFDLSAILVMAPLAIAAMMEHIGDISAISSTVGDNFIEDPGLHRTLMGDGLATALAGFFGGPPNTTYGENTGVLVLSKVYDPRVVRLAAYFAILLSFSPKFDALVTAVPAAVIGGISFILYGMIAAVGVRNVVENRVDLTKSRNLIIAAIIFVSGLGIDAITFTVGGTDVALTGMAIAAIAGVVLNAILPGNDYEFGKTEHSDNAHFAVLGDKRFCHIVFFDGKGTESIFHRAGQHDRQCPVISLMLKEVPESSFGVRDDLLQKCFIAALLRDADDRLDGPE